MLVTFGICFKQHFDTRYLVFYNPSPPRMFLSLSLEYRIQHGAIGPLYVTSSYSTWIFCRGVSGFATDCPCDVWCRGLTTGLLHVGSPFGNRFLNTSWAVGLTYWIVYLNCFVFWHMQLYMSWYIISLFGDGYEAKLLRRQRAVDGNDNHLLHKLLINCYLAIDFLPTRRYLDITTVSFGLYLRRVCYFRLCLKSVGTLVG